MTTPPSAEAQGADRTPADVEMTTLVAPQLIFRINRTWWVHVNHIVAIRDDGGGFGTLFTTDGREIDFEDPLQLVDQINGDDE